MKQINEKLDDEKGILANIYSAIGHYALGESREYWRKEFDYWIKEMEAYSYGMAQYLEKKFEKLRNKSEYAK